MPQTVKDLAPWRAQALEALDTVAGYPFQPGGPGGEVFTVPHPLMLDDEENAAVERAVGMLATASAILGADTYSRFRADGGRAGDVLIAWRLMGQGIALDPNSQVFTAWSGDVLDSSSQILSTTTRPNIVPSPNGGGQSWQAPVS